MKIVVLDGYTLNPGDLTWEGLDEFGEVTIYDRTDSESIINRIGEAEIVFTNKTPLSKEILLACPNIKFIGVLATGYNVVDVESAKELNIPVCNVPSYGTDAVSQYVFALLLGICHRVEMHSKTVFNGEWENNPDFCYWRSPLVELAGKTMGIIGLGRIGRRTAEIAQAFGMNVLVNDSKMNKENETNTFKYAKLDELYEKSDVISLHVPLKDSTRAMINKNSISKMKDGVIIINTSRGPLIVEEDLVMALKSGKVMGAGLDVVSSEPIEGNSVLLNAPNVIITPHIAWAPKEARERLLKVAIENLKKFIDGDIINVVNS